MWMTDYLREIQRQLITVFGFKENPDKPGIPMNISDGEYPMEIDGRIDNVCIVDGKISSCCNF